MVVSELDRVFDSKHVTRAFQDVVNEGRLRRGLAHAGGPGHKDKAMRSVEQVLYARDEVRYDKELLER